MANHCARAACSQIHGVFDLGGPVALSFLHVVQIYERLLGTTLTIQRIPAVLVRLGGIVLRPINPAVAELMRLTYSLVVEKVLPHPATAAGFGVSFQTPEQFLSAKLAL